MNLPLLFVVSLCLSLVSLWSAAMAQDGAYSSSRKSDDPFQLNAERNVERFRIQRRQTGAAYSQLPAQQPSAPGPRANTLYSGLRAEDWAGIPRAATAPLRGSASKSKAAATQFRTMTAKDLADFDLELIVDQSMSMRRRDCPGGASRWEWCGWQLSNLSNQLAVYTPRGFTLTTFASEYQSYPNATAADVQRLFAYTGLASGTRLSRPLGARLDHYFANRTKDSRPLLIVVITDGAPSPAQDGVLVAGNLIDASRRMDRPDEVNVVFFQIGAGDPFGRIFLNQMDHSLVKAGAKHDIVQTVSFERLQQQGLTNSLVNTVQRAGTSAK